MLDKKTWTLTERQLCDCEMILNGSFYPLNGFMNEVDYNQVLENMRINTGELFPIPIVLDVDEIFSSTLNTDDKIFLRSKEGFIIAKMNIESIWRPNLKKEAKLVYKTEDRLHPAVNFLFSSSNKIYLGGKIEKTRMPTHYDFVKYRKGPKEVKSIFKKMGWTKVIAFQTRNPLHKAHVEMTLQAMKSINANLFLHPVIGITKPGDINHFTRVRCYEYVIKKYPDDSVFLALLPLAMRMGGPREALCTRL